MNSNEETIIIVLVMDYLYQKIQSASRIPQQVSNFTGCDSMMDLLEGNDRRFVEILRMPKLCFLGLCDLLEQNEVQDKGL